MRIARAYFLESRFEFLKIARMPRYVISTLAFPLMFYAFFGLLFGGQRVGSISQSTYLLATYGAFGVIGATLFSFGLSVALERGQGWLLVKKASPMPPLAYFTAKIVTSVAFAVLVIVLMFALGAIFGGVHLTLGTWFALGGSLTFGALPFCSLGLAIGYLAGPNSAAPIVQLIYLPMAFFSGLWVPIAFLPPAVQTIAKYLPAYHLSQLALGTMGAGDGTRWWMHVLALFSFTTLCLSAAAIGFQRDEGTSYG